MPREIVSIRRCTPPADDNDIINATETVLGDLGDLTPLFRDKRKVLIKTNAGIPAFTITEGRQTELTDPAVLEGVIRVLRQVTDAEIVVGDAPTMEENRWSVYEGLGLPERLEPYPNVRLVDFNNGPFQAVPHDNPLMFREYLFHPDIADADAVVSVAKMKAHRALGCTLCIKNLFGLVPPAIYGYPRHYFHDRLIRLSRVLADLALLLKPTLNVVDGIVAANHGEWGGTPMVPGVLVAGTNIVATDATAARLMAFDPAATYPTYPFFYRHNAIKLAADAGLGPVEKERIEVRGPDPESIQMPFEIKRYGGTQEDRDRELQRGARCVRIYRERREEYLKQYEGQLVALRDGEVLWAAPDIHTHHKLERESGLDFRNGPQVVIRVVPEDKEIERLDAYEPYEHLFPDEALREAA